MTEAHELGPGHRAAAKEEIRSILVETARRLDVITYLSLVTRLQSVRLQPNSPELAHLLGEVSESEDREGRGLLTVIVVRQDEQLPGAGFFQLAARLGRDTSDKVTCWANEIKRVHDAWGEAD